MVSAWRGAFGRAVDDGLSGGDGTSEQGYSSGGQRFRGIADEHGRLMVVMSHNTDSADG